MVRFAAFLIIALGQVQAFGASKAGVQLAIMYSARMPGLSALSPLQAAQATRFMSRAALEPTVLSSPAFLALEPRVRAQIALFVADVRRMSDQDAALHEQLLQDAAGASSGEAVSALAASLFEGPGRLSLSAPVAAAPPASRGRRLLAAGRKRLRELGIAIGTRTPGPLNAITDVAGVAVGHATIKRGTARTGVTAILPHQGDLWNERVPAAVWALNGNGELTGAHWVAEQGALEVPIMLTNTFGVGPVHQGVVNSLLKRYPAIGDTDDVALPIVGECDDSTLNDARACHVKARHAEQAIAAARTGGVPEGAVGAGTGMIAFGFKSGIGTSSRRLTAEEGGWTVGVLVNNNMGYDRKDLTIDGVRVGAQLPEIPDAKGKEGSIIIVLATDAPLDSRTLGRLAKRAALGLSRTGAVSRHGSGDIIIAFSTGNRIPKDPKGGTYDIQVVPDNKITALFEAAVEAAEEAIINSLTAAETTTGRDGSVAHALPLDQVKAIVRRARREPR